MDPKWKAQGTKPLSAEEAVRLLGEFLKDPNTGKAVQRDIRKDISGLHKAMEKLCASNKNNDS
ncbi:hypothetical protein BWQ96_02700 [Gracilariopsis chorda]|uniref:Uncharacterized protein n=1 Tax=Gracilariopsis chorda TaxID=448386 RepID=A0A2V3IZG9_9FLOR|nr:hypothetical protein BWQ96_02700 [Gracilariopsis chorda]|eukprot:PXF47556.1 hypothetical protein BWQ96_02700 [Gracilariopsis chorda]